MAKTWFDDIIFSQEFLDSPRFCRRLHNYKVTVHGIFVFLLKNCKVRNKSGYFPNFLCNFVILNERYIIMTENTRKKFVKWFWIIISCPVILLAGMLLAVWLFADIPSFEELESPESKLATEVIADDGQVLTTFHIEN